MRFKKQKRHRRFVRFYKTCFGFREPFKVLCDGTFVHHVVAHNISPRDEAVSNILGGSVKLFTTRCAISELKSLGGSHSKSFSDANSNYMIARCDHEKRKHAVACIADIIGENNPEHFFVATQDADLRKKLQEIPGVPVIFGLRNALFLERPSSFQRDCVKASEEARQHVRGEEYGLLVKRAKARIRSISGEDSVVADEHAVDVDSEPFIGRETRRSGVDTKDRAQFKRNRAKGPNPLSCLKKKKPVTSVPTSKKVEDGEKQGDDQTKKSKTKKRKRNRKSRNVSVARSNAD